MNRDARIGEPLRLYTRSITYTIFMKSNLIRAGGFSFALVLLLSSAPGSAHAAESASLTQLLAAIGTRSDGYYRLSSSDNRKIRELDDDPVEEMPIPILTGVAVRNLSKNFGDPRDGGSRNHEGLDIMAPKGAFIVSPTDAVVTSTGSGANSGKYVYTANPGGERFAYMHLDSIEVKRGDVLEPGDLIGTVGNTGNASGGAPHLHFEIREDRDPSDPYPRLTREFTTKERGEALVKIIKEADNDDVDEIIADYRSILIAARAAGVKLTEEIEDELGTATVSGSLLAGASAFSRDLTLGSRGNDVSSLQAFLIAEDSGPAADALLSAGATGYFGPITQRALAEYQAKVGISPSSGYFGPLTRARILSVI